MKSKMLPWRRHMAAAALCLWGGVGAVWAANTNIANSPIFQGGVSVEPNLMVLMDTSDSMKWTHMPDSMEIKEDVQYRAYKSSACNSLYYDPGKTYKLPKDAMGKELPMPSFKEAFYDYYVDGGAKKVDLETEFQAHDEETVSSVRAKPDEKQHAYYYVAGKIAPDRFYEYCRNNGHKPNSAQDGGNYFSKKIVQSGEKNNFAIWYSYYRTRMAMVKSALSLALDPVEDTVRIGFIAVNPTIDLKGKYENKVQADRFQKPDIFKGDQRKNFYKTLFAQTPTGRSPAREGLARVGRYYGGKQDGINADMGEDPVIHACQRNFTILTTDGYWNAADETKGPVKMDGVALVGNQDGQPPGPTDDTDPKGLVPYGVYDGGPGTAGWTDITKKYKEYYQSSCSEWRKVATRTAYQKYKIPVTYKTTKAFVPGTTRIERRKDVQRLQSRWKSYSTYERYKQTTKWVHKYSYTHYDFPAGEEEVAVPTCVTGACDTVVHANVDVLPGQCTPQTANASNGYTHVECNPDSRDDYVISCGTSSSTRQISCGPKETKTVQEEKGDAKNGYGKSSACKITDNGWNGWNWYGPEGEWSYWKRTCHVTKIEQDKLVARCDPNDQKPGETILCKNGVTLKDYYDVASCTQDEAAGVYCGHTYRCIPDASNGKNCTSSTSGTAHNGEDLGVVATSGECKAQDPSASNGWIQVKCESQKGTKEKPVDPNDPDCAKGSTPNAANGWKGFSCGNEDKKGSGLDDPNCKEEAASKDNEWTTTSCRERGWWEYGERLRTRTLYKFYKRYPGEKEEKYIRQEWRDDVWAGDTCEFPTLAKIPPKEPEVVVETANGGVAYVGSVNSLADVAQYYYATDLRDWVGKPDVWPHNVKPRTSGPLGDKVRWQHMTTFVVGLGVSGTVVFDKDYAKPQGDFALIRKGHKGWPVWPNPSIDYSNQENYHVGQSIDDFWHAGVNGRGGYYAADNAESLIKTVDDIINSLNDNTAVGAGAPVDNPLAPNTSFRTTYSPHAWWGDLIAARFDDVKKETKGYWSANQELASRVQDSSDSRRIFFRDSSDARKQRDFKAANLPTKAKTQLEAGLKKLSQYTLLKDEDKKKITLATLVNYLRGQKQHADKKVYRQRDQVLGDFIGSRPVYVTGAKAAYIDSGYRTFKKTVANRKGVVYAGANDGMLHAFDANTGEELWAYVPTAVMGEMWRLADTKYAEYHRYFVDGTPVVGDVYDTTNSEWKTILVGGFNSGGNGYYALDITDPDDPKSLWESGESCSTCDIGLSFGKPIITKLKDGTWTVFVTSGYNNKDGKGILFALNALTGALIEQYNTGAGAAAQPAGLVHVSGYAQLQRLNNTVERIYGGDLLGNIWRFDVNGNMGGNAVELVGVAQDPDGKTQPITSAPALPRKDGKHYVVLGTGRLLHNNDVPVEQVHSVYSIVDTLEPGKHTVNGSKAQYDNLRTSLTKFKMNKDMKSECADTATACDSDHPNGWLMDFYGKREHVDTDITMSPGGVIVVGSNEPAKNICENTAIGRLHFLAVHSGENVIESLAYGGANGSGDNGYLLQGGFTMMDINDDYTLPDGCKQEDAVCLQTRLSDGTLRYQSIPDLDAVQGQDRMSWRELVAPTPEP